MSDKPKRPDDLVDLEIDGHVDSGLTHEQAERIKRAKRRHVQRLRPRDALARRAQAHSAQAEAG